MPLRPDEGYSEPPQPASPTPPPPPVRSIPLGTTPGLTEIHPEQVEAAAKLFEDSADAVNDLIRGGREHLRMQPMADDDVSKRAARSFTDAGVEGPESHVAALTGYQKWLLLIAFNIRASAAQYWRTDNDTARTAHVSGLGGLARD